MFGKYILETNNIVDNWHTGVSFILVFLLGDCKEKNILVNIWILWGTFNLDKKKWIVGTNDPITWVFFNSYWCSFLNGSVWLEVADSPVGRVGDLQLFIDTQWSSQCEGPGCHAPAITTENQCAWLSSPPPPPPPFLRDKMAAIFQTFSKAFSWMKMYNFRLRFHWNLFPKIHLIIFQHWFR